MAAIGITAVLGRFGHAGPPVSAQVAAQLDPPVGESDSCAGGVGLFSASLCTISVTTQDGAPAADGSVIVRLTGPAGSAVLSCADTPCQSIEGGQSLILTCTSGAPPDSCVFVDYVIASPIAACLNSPSQCSTGANLSSSGATVVVSFTAAPGNNGAGGVVLGTDAIAFAGASIGTLLVTATPQVIPSNGTVTSLVTATFACSQNSGIQFGPNGIPLSNMGFRNARRASSVVFQPVLGTNDAAVCGAGLPGTFTFTAPKNVIFDNFRPQEGVGCGVGSNGSPSADSRSSRPTPRPFAAGLHLHRRGGPRFWQRRQRGRADSGLVCFLRCRSERRGVDGRDGVAVADTDGHHELLAGDDRGRGPRLRLYRARGGPERRADDRSRRRHRHLDHR